MRFQTFLVMCAASSTLLMAQPAQNGSIATSDRKFLEAALQTGQSEIALGHLAMQRAANPQVKALAAAMVRDHTHGNQAIEVLAKDRGLTLTVGKEAHEHEKAMELTGAAFDRAYVSDIASSHRKIIADFEKEAQYATDPEVRSLATNMLPNLRTHYDRAVELQKEFAKGTADRTAK